VIPAFEAFDKLGPHAEDIFSVSQDDVTSVGELEAPALAFKKRFAHGLL
jgi:hypothetical protein